MSDLRFKISGGTEPYTVELIRGSDGQLISKKLIEHSGFNSPDQCNYSCVIFSNLNETECYYLNIEDNIGNNKSTSCYITPANPVYVPFNVNVNLLGTISAEDTFRTVTSPKFVEISPSLLQGQCVNLTLDGSTCVFSNNDSSVIEIFKKCTASGPYQLVCSLNNGESSSVNISVGKDDVVCYNITTTYDNCDSCACLVLSNASLSGSFTGSDIISCGPNTLLSLVGDAEEFVVTQHFLSFSDTTDISSSSTCGREFDLIISPSLPNNNSTTISFDTTMESNVLEFNGSSCVIILCKADGSASFTPIYSVCNIDCNADQVDVDMNSGDELKICLNSYLPASSGCVSSSINMTSSIDSPNINTSISSPSFYEAIKQK